MGVCHAVFLVAFTSLCREPSLEFRIVNNDPVVISAATGWGVKIPQLVQSVIPGLWQQNSAS